MLEDCASMRPQVLAADVFPTTVLPRRVYMPHVVVHRSIIQPMPGRIHRGTQPSLRPAALVHVDEGASAGVLAVLRGLPKRGEAALES